MYPTGSILGLFYGTAKVHKLGKGDLNELTMGPIIWNIGKATCETAKYINSLLALLGKSDHSLLNFLKMCYIYIYIYIYINLYIYIYI